MTSYQKRKLENEQLKKELEKMKAFERMFKNYIKAINNNNEQSKKDIEKWYSKNSTRYSNEI